MSTFQIISLVLFVSVWLWIVYEMWRAPLMEETADGKLITKRPTKKLKELFKKKPLSSSAGTYKELEKLGRGRSKY
jgi:hypothetical protein